MPNASTLAVSPDPTRWVSTSFSYWSNESYLSIDGHTLFVPNAFEYWSNSEEAALSSNEFVEYDALDVQLAPHGVKMRGRLLSGGFETWLSESPNTENPSGLPIENIVVSDEWEG